jgi:hypothetical protein
VTLQLSLVGYIFIPQLISNKREKARVGGALSTMLSAKDLALVKALAS